MFKLECDLDEKVEKAERSQASKLERAFQRSQQKIAELERSLEELKSYTANLEGELRMLKSAVFSTSQPVTQHYDHQRRHHRA